MRKLLIITVFAFIFGIYMPGIIIMQLPISSENSEKFQILSNWISTVLTGCFTFISIYLTFGFEDKKNKRSEIRKIFENKKAIYDSSVYLVRLEVIGNGMEEDREARKLDFHLDHPNLSSTLKLNLTNLGKSPIINPKIHCFNIDNKSGSSHQLEGYYKSNDKLSFDIDFHYCVCNECAKNQFEKVHNNFKVAISFLDENLNVFHFPLLLNFKEDFVLYSGEQFIRPILEMKGEHAIFNSYTGLEMKWMIKRPYYGFFEYLNTDERTHDRLSFIFSKINKVANKKVMAGGGGFNFYKENRNLPVYEFVDELHFADMSKIRFYTYITYNYLLDEVKLDFPTSKIVIENFSLVKSIQIRIVYICLKIRAWFLFSYNKSRDI